MIDPNAATPRDGSFLTLPLLVLVVLWAIVWAYALWLDR